MYPFGLGQNNRGGLPIVRKWVAHRLDPGPFEAAAAAIVNGHNNHDGMPRLLQFCLREIASSLYANRVDKCQKGGGRIKGLPESKSPPCRTDFSENTFVICLLKLGQV